MRKHFGKTMLMAMCAAILACCIVCFTPTEASAALEPVVLHVGSSAQQAYTSSGWLASQISYLTVSDPNVANASVVSRSVSFSSVSGLAYEFTIAYRGIANGTATVTFYNESGYSMGSVEVRVTGHEAGEEWITTELPTCTEDGTKEKKCIACGVTMETATIPYTGHTEGSWVTVKDPTCTEEGSREQQCSVCQATLDTEAIPSTGHTEGSWVTVKEPTCTEEGSKEQQCSVCQHVLGMEVISATGHKDGEWKTAKAANCKEDGLEELFCANCGEVVDQKILPAAGVEHKPGELVTTVQATCITDGKMAQSCTVCGIELKTETIPATGHTEGKWVVVKKATRTEEGLKQISCIVCGAVLEEEVIPVVVTDMWYNKTICTLGIRFRDIKPEIITDDAQWYMFTPVDLSTDGVTELQLVAGNVHFVGKAKVTVQDGVLIVSAKPLSGLEVLDLTFTVLPDVASAETVDISTMKQYAFDTEISIQDDLDGDTNVLLYVYGHAHYDAMDEQIARFWHTSNSYEKQVEDWKNMMD